MNAALYADYVADLRGLFAELDRHPERFQTFGAHLELAVAGGLVVYETTRRKGQTDSLFYGCPAGTGANQQMSQASAFAAIDRFFALGQFVALTGNRKGGDDTLDAQYPHCAVRFSYRRKGHPAARAMLMVFVGFNDDADALHYVGGNDPSLFVAERPYRTERAYEWT
ncbi:hypothetical protein [Shinella sp. HZN7]|uniref:hypothetical protein n=1 Tax=Shinella sp. (strain HZN7) TaxID=879274 RepID=UPI0007DA68F2|nr:hypothetical protein [Shinella sp. HZN7]ANH08387.1 hypothetical protein shn_30100 [Shinella sp. HZN7]